MSPIEWRGHCPKDTGGAFRQRYGMAWVSPRQPVAGSARSELPLGGSVLAVHRYVEGCTDLAHRLKR